MNQDLGIALNSLVKFLVCGRRVIDVNIVRDDKARICLSRDNHVSQVSIVLLNIALACADSKTLPRLSGHSVIQECMATYLLE